MLYNYKIVAAVLLTVGLILFLAGFTMETENYNALSTEEENVIVHKGTEPPFSGKYNDFYETGSYHCKRCNARLYSSADKFQTTCGWPSFDDEIAGAIKKQIDADGFRTEMVCANCGAHLGHVFVGERLTEKNVRHCVNSISLVFVPGKDVTKMEKAYFAGGCFWGVEYYFEQKVGVISATSGYMGGSMDDPSYHEVCTGKTGHLEVVEVAYDAAKVSYEELAKFFFEIHDPTQADGQGPDIGSQYLSAVFYLNDVEEKIAHKLINILETKGYDIATKVISTQTFWPAEDYHQDYYDRKNQQPYCHAYEKKF